MVGVVALQRKILVLMYTLWKKDEVFDENYEENRNPGLQQNEAGRGISSLPAQDELHPKRMKSSFV